MKRLSTAVEDALINYGLSLLSDSDRFTETILDEIGSSSNIATLLRTGCDKSYLDYYASASSAKTIEAFENASTNASDYLVSEYAIDHDTAQEVSFDIARGCAAFLDIGDIPRDTTDEGTDRTHKVTPRLIPAVVIPIIMLLTAGVAIILIVMPTLRNNLLAKRTTINSIQCTTSSITDIHGDQMHIMRLHNPTDSPARASTKNTWGGGSSFANIPPNGDGLLLLEGEYDPSKVTVEFHNNNTRTFFLTWDVIYNERGSEFIVIRNDSGKRITGCDVILVDSGLSTTVRMSRNIEALEVGENQLFSGNVTQVSSSGNNLKIDNNTELFVKGTKVQRAHLAEQEPSE